MQAAATYPSPADARVGKFRSTMPVQTLAVPAFAVEASGLRIEGLGVSKDSGREDVLLHDCLNPRILNRSPLMLL